MAIDRVTINYRNGDVKQFIFDVSKYEEMVKRDKLILKARKSKEINSYDFTFSLKGE